MLVQKFSLLLSLGFIVLLGAGCSLDSLEKNKIESLPTPAVLTPTEEGNSNNEKTGVSYADIRDKSDFIVEQRVNGFKNYFAYDLEEKQWYPLLDTAKTGQMFTLLKSFSDGSWLAQKYQLNKNGYAMPSNGVYRVELSSGKAKERLLVEARKNINSTFLSADEKTLYFTDSDGNYDAEDSILYKLNLETGEKVQLAEFKGGIFEIFYLIGLKDENTLLYGRSAGDGGGWTGSIQALNLTTKEVETVGTFDGEVDSPGSRILFDRRVQPFGYLYLEMEKDSETLFFVDEASVKHELARESLKAYGYGYTPFYDAEFVGDKAVVTKRNPNDSWEIYSIDLKTGQKQVLSSCQDEKVCDTNFSPVNDDLIFLPETNEGGTFINISTGTTSPFTFPSFETASSSTETKIDHYFLPLN